MATAVQEIAVLTESRLIPEATRVLDELGARSRVTRIDKVHKDLKGDNVLFYFSGHEPLPALRDYLRQASHLRTRTFAVYISNHSMDNASQFAYLAGQEFGKGKTANFVFTIKMLKNWLEQRNALAHGSSIQHPPSATDLARLRRKLGLTQEQLAAALHITTRTLQNWERDVTTSQLQRKTRDLWELAELIDDYVIDGKESEWLRTPLPAFRDRRPLDLLRDGKIRDLIVEFRRLQEGQPV
jgi:DNA-binding transcriptional regulator YiaG